MIKVVGVWRVQDSFSTCRLSHHKFQETKAFALLDSFYELHLVQACTITSSQPFLLMDHGCRCLESPDVALNVNLNVTHNVTLNVSLNMTLIPTMSELWSWQLENVTHNITLNVALNVTLKVSLNVTLRPTLSELWSWQPTDTI